jgi:hypothetical protein
MAFQIFRRAKHSIYNATATLRGDIRLAGQLHDKTMKEAFQLFSQLFPQHMPINPVFYGSKKFGSQYAAPSWIKDMHLLISPGVGPDISFDLEMMAYNIHTVLIDKQIPPNLCQLPSCCRYISKFLGTSTQFARSPESFVSLESLLSHYDGKSYERKILQMDIEGAEWPILLCDSAALSQFELIIIELHGLPALFSYSMNAAIYSGLVLLLDSFTPFFARVNDVSGYAMVRGYKIPELLELTLVNKSMHMYSGAHVPFILEKDNLGISESIQSLLGAK